MTNGTCEGILFVHVCIEKIFEGRKLGKFIGFVWQPVT